MSLALLTARGFNRRTTGHKYNTVIFYTYRESSRRARLGLPIFMLHRKSLIDGKYILLPVPNTSLDSEKLHRNIDTYYRLLNEKVN